MNQNVLYSNQRAVTAQPELHFCFKCRWEGRTGLKNCPQCGRILFSQTNVRWRGVALIFVGLFLSGLMSVVTFFVTALLLAAKQDPRNGAKFNGDEHLLLMMYVIFGALIGSGLTAIVGGLWQAVFGRRNMFLIWGFFAFVFIAFFVGGLFRGLAG